MTRLVLPLAACRRSEAEPTTDGLRVWVKELGLKELAAVRQVFASTRIGEFSSFAYPFADYADRLLIDSWVLWTLIVDQLFEEKLAAGALQPVPCASAEPEAALRAVDPGTPPEHHLGALADLTRRTVAGMPQEWQEEFRAHVALFVCSCHAEAARRIPDIPQRVDLPSFIRLRRGSFATDLFLDLTEKVYQIDRPRDPRSGPAAMTLRACAADLGGWCNDLLSYRRERGHEDRNNLVLLLAKERHYSLDEAVRDAHAHVRDRAWQFQESKADLVRCVREEEAEDDRAAAAMQWALGVELLVSGSLTYQQISRRWQEQ